MINIELLSKTWTILESFPKGQVIIADGDELDDKMYIIKEGTVGVYKNFRKQGEICVAKLVHGDSLGEMELFMEINRTATCIAEEDVTAFVVDREHALEFFKNETEATLALIKALCFRLANTTKATAEAKREYDKDVSALNNEVSMLEHSANTDPLTGVFNRRFFMASIALMINNAIRDNKTSYIVLLDLDNFKNINDTYGHRAGDDVLIAFADMAHNSMRKGDLFARYGGEEFVMLISSNEKESISTLLERIRKKTVDLNIMSEGKAIHFSTSIGAATINSGSDIDIEMAIAQADRALYTAKREGRNRIVFYQK